MRFGGSFAPPVDDAVLTEYANRAAGAPHEIAAPMMRLITMLRKFRETPASGEPSQPHRSGMGTVTPLEAVEKQRIADVVPARDELELFSARFDAIDPVADKPLRDAAFHLLWFARELEMGREPCTNDML